MLPLFPLIHIQHSTFHRRPSTSVGSLTADWSNDKGLSLLAVGPSDKEIFDFHKKDSQVCFKA